MKIIIYIISLTFIISIANAEEKINVANIKLGDDGNKICKTLNFKKRAFYEKKGINKESLDLVGKGDWCILYDSNIYIGTHEDDFAPRFADVIYLNMQNKVKGFHLVEESEYNHGVLNILKKYTNCVNNNPQLQNYVKKHINEYEQSYNIRCNNIKAKISIGNPKIPTNGIGSMPSFATVYYK